MSWVIAETGIDSYWSDIDKGWVRNHNYATLSTDLAWLTGKLDRLKGEYCLEMEIRQYPAPFRRPWSSNPALIDPNRWPSQRRTD